MATNPIGRGHRDADEAVCTAQIIPLDGADDVSENTYDTGLTTPRLGLGARIIVVVSVTTAFAHSAGAPTLDIVLVTDGDDALGSNTNLATVMTIPNAAAAGAVYIGSVPVAVGQTYERYFGLELSPSTTQFTAGAIDAWITIL